MTRRVPELSRAMPRAYVELNPSDAVAQDIWVRRYPKTTQPALSYAFMSYDTVRQRAVRFGGFDGKPTA